MWNRLDGVHTVDEVTDSYTTERGPVSPNDIARIMAELVHAGFASAKELDPEAAVAAGPRQPWWRRLRRRLMA